MLSRFNRKLVVCDVMQTTSLGKTNIYDTNAPGNSLFVTMCFFDAAMRIRKGGKEMHSGRRCF